MLAYDDTAAAGNSYFAVFTGIRHAYDSVRLHAIIVYYEVNVLYSGMHMLYI